jgi:hypothetical protein
MEQRAGIVQSIVEVIVREVKEFFVGMFQQEILTPFIKNWYWTVVGVAVGCGILLWLFTRSRSPRSD